MRPERLIAMPSASSAAGPSAPGGNGKYARRFTRNAAPSPSIRKMNRRLVLRSSQMPSRSRFAGPAVGSKVMPDTPPKRAALSGAKLVSGGMLNSPASSSHGPAGGGGAGGRRAALHALTATASATLAARNRRCIVGGLYFAGPELGHSSARFPRFDVPVEGNRGQPQPPACV